MSPAHTIAASRYHVPNLERGLAILEHLSDQAEGATMTDVSRALGLPKNSVFRILSTLDAAGYVLRDEHDQRFRLSSKLLALAYKGTSADRLLKLAGDILVDLRNRTGETALIGRLIDHTGVVLEQVPSRHPIKVQVEPGTRFPLHTAAPSKAILASLPEAECENMLAQIQWARFTDHTITSARKFRAALARARTRGYASDRGEELAGITCLAAPVFDHRSRPIAALWITGPDTRLRGSDFDRLGRIVARSGMALSRRLGFVGKGGARKPGPG